jgi:hypothetical protein
VPATKTQDGFVIADCERAMSKHIKMMLRSFFRSQSISVAGPADQSDKYELFSDPVIASWSSPDLLVSLECALAQPQEKR